MPSDIERLLLMMSDMEKMLDIDDDLSNTILNCKRDNIELNEDELEMISAAGNTDLNCRYNDDDIFDGGNRNDY